MKRYILSVIFLAAFSFHAFSENWISIGSLTPQPASKVLVSSTTDVSVVRFSLQGFVTHEVNTPQGPALVIGLGEATPILEFGSPDLPKLAASVIIPDLAGMSIEVIGSEYTDYDNVLIAPSKGNLTRDIDPATVPYVFGSVYGSDAFYPGKLASLRDPYISRDFRGQTIIAYPFQYNPVTRTLRVYHEMTVRVSKVSNDGINPLVRNQQPETVDVQFSNIYRRHFLNYGSSLRYDPVEEYGNMLIISYGAFMPAMQPFIDWKKQMGYPVEIVDVASIGNSTAIKSFITDYYNTNGLTFVVLVGDHAQVPTSSTSAGDSDNNYTYVVGNDHYPDLFIGRFSAENTDQLSTQVSRTLEYEQDPLLGVDWFTKCVGIASDQGPGDDGEMDYQHIRNIADDLLDFTYTYAHELFDGSQGGNDAPGNPSPSLVAAAVNSGSSIINYTGHGSQGSWGTSGFSISDVNNLTNDNMLPFIWSVACVNGDFVNATCFAEAWLRATHNGEPTGAIAFLGSTINQSWNPPMAAQDEMNDILVESYDYVNRTFAALSMHGCMLMNDEYGGGGDEMTDTWTVFGDPSVMVRTAVPTEMTVTHNPVLFIGTEELVVLCDAEGARATLMVDGTVMATGVVESGTVTLSFAQLTEPGTATLTITAFNRLPYIAGIDVIPAEGPFIVMESYDVNDPAGNNNGLPDYSETISLGIELENVGVEDAADVVVTLSVASPYILVTDPEEIYELVPAGESVMIEGAFTFEIASDVPDQHAAIFYINSSNGEETWQSIFLMSINAPILHINALTIDDSANGNGDGELDPGESVVMQVNYSNTGHAVAYDVDVLLEGQSGYIDIANPDQNFASIGFLGAYDRTFDVVVAEIAPEGIFINFRNEMTMGDLVIEKVTPIKVSAMCEDFETNGFLKFDWDLSGDQPWTITSSYPFEGNFSARSGAITHNQTSTISLDYQVMQGDSIVFYRKVSSEPTDVMRFFVNDEVVGQWSGTIGGWKREAFYVTAGQKEFTWSYTKNNIGSNGSDCGWLDEIILPPPIALTLWAGPDDEVCYGSAFQLNQSYGTYYQQIQWTTSGGGSFDDNAIMHPVYTPGGDDMTGENVILTMTLIGNEGAVVSDEMTLTFKPEPDAPEMPAGPEYIDVTETETSVYTITAVEGSDEYYWVLTPAEAGTIIGSSLQGTVSWNPEFSGTAYVSAGGGNECGFGIASDALEVTVANGTVGIIDPAGTEAAVSIYPNPATGSIKLASTIDIPRADIRIYDLLGNRQYERSGVSLSGDGSFRIDVSSLPKGIYILSVKSSVLNEDIKLIIR